MIIALAVPGTIVAGEGYLDAPRWSDRERDGDEGDHERAYRAVRDGRVLPLIDILERARAEVPGRFLEAELEAEDGRLFYEIEILTPEGRVVELLYDAADGTPIRTRGHGRRNDD